MRPSRSGAIANCVRTQQCSRANQCRDGRKTACLPVTLLHVAATGPFAPTRREIASALRATRVPLSRGRGNPAVLTFRREIFPIRSAQGATTETRSRSQGPQRHKPAKIRNVNLELIGGDYAYA